ncbi:MAG TPA: hypothetical protein VHT30_08640 [Acidimicrobiales bacterium]|jgi:hypothetical protein|nr:hypothetical protein [Acidimicrobiales bacterium]
MVLVSESTARPECIAALIASTDNPRHQNALFLAPPVVVGRRDRQAGRLGCGLRSGQSRAPWSLVGPERTVPLPLGNYTSPAWAKSLAHILRYPDATIVHEEVWRVRPDGSGLEQLQLPHSLPECP